MHRKICYYLDEVDRILQGQTQYPISCEIDPSNYCQNKCNFCMFSDFLKSSRVNLDYNVYQKVVRELKQVGTMSITFTGGGEPTLHPKFREMVLEANKLRFEVGLVTNGIELDTYIDLVPMFRFVRVSLDAASRETYYKIKDHDVFEKVRENIKLAVENKENTTVGISFVICNENMYEIEEAKFLAKSLGVDYIQIKPCYGESLQKVKQDTKTIVTKRYKVKSKLPCAIAGLVGIVGADANVYYCCQKRGKEDFILGNLEVSTFKEIWKRRTEFNPDTSYCYTCRYMNYAQGYRKFSKDKYQFLRHKHFL